MNLTELGFSKEESMRYKKLVLLKMESLKFQSENTGGEIEYKGLPYYPEFAVIEGDVCFTDSDEIDEFLALEEKMINSMLGDEAV